MTFVAFTFLGDQVKIEILDSQTHSAKIDENEFLSGLIGKDASIVDKDDEKFIEVYEWCKINADFKDDLKQREVNFIFH